MDPIEEIMQLVGCDIGKQKPSIKLSSWVITNKKRSTLKIKKCNVVHEFYFPPEYADAISHYKWFVDHGYARRCISVKGHKTQVTLGHTIMELEKGKIPENMMVKYIDKNKRNNFPENLIVDIDPRKVILDLEEEAKKNDGKEVQSLRRERGRQGGDQESVWTGFGNILISD